MILQCRRVTCHSITKVTCHIVRERSESSEIIRLCRTLCTNTVVQQGSKSKETPNRWLQDGFSGGMKSKD